MSIFRRLKLSWRFALHNTLVTRVTTIDQTVNPLVPAINKGSGEPNVGLPSPRPVWIYLIKPGRTKSRTGQGQSITHI